MKRLLAIALLVAACGGSQSGDAGSPSPGLPLVGASSTATEEPLATENLASVEPASDPPAGPALPVKVTKAPGSVAQGKTASVSIKTTKKAECDIDVQYASGSSQAKGLEPKTADADGAVTWKWEIGRNTTKGKWPVMIDCVLGDRSGTAETSVTVK